MHVMAKHELEVPLNGSSGGAHGTQLTDRSGNKDENQLSTQDVIRLRAYEFYLERGTAPDNALEDWLRAEREFRRSPDERTGAEVSPASHEGMLGGGPPHARL
jgi:hypothetical protein